MLIFIHKFLNTLVLLILKCFCHTHTHTHTHIQTELQVHPLSWVHSPLLAHPFCACSSFGQTCASPNTLLIPTAVRKHPTSLSSHTPGVGLCVLHSILVLQHLRAGTSPQPTVCDADGEQQVLLLPLQGFSPLLKNIHASLYTFSS